MADTMIERAAKAAREEVLRQYRDDDRGRCPAGPAWYEEHVAPGQIARAVIAAMREPIHAALKPFADACEQIDDSESDEEWAKFRLLIKDYRRARDTLATIDAALDHGPL